MDAPICANDAAEMASITDARNSERMEWVIRIVQSFYRFILRLARWCSGAAGCVDGEARFPGETYCIRLARKWFRSELLP
jgi:hypothetical protein